jgi:predicted nucleotidyltransferase
MVVQTKEQVFNVLREYQQQLNRLGVKRCGIFGSFVRGQQNPSSDVDILVEFETGKKTFDNFMHLAFLLENAFERKVDLVTREALSPYIGPYILREVEYASFSS